MPATAPLPLTLGELRASQLFSESRLTRRSIKDEMRANLMARLKARETVFPGIVGFDDTVIPQIENAILSRQNFILLGLRGQAKSRILRALTALLDEKLPYIAGCEIRDNPYQPLCKRCRELVRAARRCHSDRLPRSRRPLRGEAGHARRDRGRPHRRSRSHQGRARRRRSFERAHHALWPAAPRQSRHLRHQRAARSRRQNPGGAVQHHAGGRRPDQRLSRAPGTRCRARLQRQPRGLHRARQNRHPAQRPHRL